MTETDTKAKHMKDNEIINGKENETKSKCDTIQEEDEV